MTDLSHIQRQIQNDQIKTDDFRKQAANEQRLAKQYQDRGTGGEATFHEQEAARMNEKANAMEEEAKQLQSEKEQQEQRLKDLQQQRETLNNNYNAELKALDREIAQVRGSQFTL